MRNRTKPSGLPATALQPLPLLLPLDRKRLQEPGEPGRRDSTLSIADRDALERAFVDLSPEHRAVVLLHHHIGWTLPEVADIVGVPLGTVKSRLHYATRAMRAALEPADPASHTERMPA